MAGLKIILADTPELREAAFSFRYQIYVEQMQRRQLYADHSKRLIIEPQDELGRIHVALDDAQQVVGTIRSNGALDHTMGYYRKVYGLEIYDFGDLASVQITTKLMIDPSLSRTGLAARLIREFAVDGYRRGIRINMIDCNKPLMPVFSRMGYFSYCGWRFHKEFGTIRPMFHPVDAVNYLSRIGCFLAEPASRFFLDNQFGGYDVIRRLATPPLPPDIHLVEDLHFA